MAEDTDPFLREFVIAFATIKHAAIQLEGTLDGGSESEVFAALDAVEAQCRRARALMRKYTAARGRGLRANGEPDHRWGANRRPDPKTDLRFLA